MHSKITRKEFVKEMTDEFVFGPQSNKDKSKRGFVWRLVINTPLRRSGMARILK